ncbi:UDP-N-acetylmuramoyl-L-alanine--D-glutamate ligase [Candidatus Ishikawella capsulata]|uniref:UDP-N-acetylmuramoylalanine--D-glutamate ligase n=1 Tax=Candidatus Ishikawaella capsulata Mpkobe TaxID=476281 RepID=C5WD44_9ENTR|nr:UDP-N-acetylmuramoyl-L-alanine--D-glutamate ligase [Candidatus Ishikawaella capsulata]BAH83250.1 UDP-N-acetylmuramoyl-L-alanyl-D-glutamate synthetase [Candidatus Ishikawaella capsulata Mpkobe]
MTNYINKKIVIIGLGQTGISCINFFLERDIIPRIIDTRISPPNLDKLPKNLDYHLGSINSSWVLSADLIVVSPGISIRHPVIKQAILAGIEVVGDIEIFCREAKAPIIAITGSNGKSTVSTLVSEMAQTAGLVVGLGGNINLSALELLKNPAQFYILELSSFQLETTNSLKAAVATILNVTEDHMDRYPLGIQEYQNAKLKIYKDAHTCIINANDNMTKPPDASSKFCISFGINKGDYALQQNNHISWLQVRGKKILNTNAIKLIGKHNYSNALVALAIADIIGIPRADSLRIITTFRGLPHRFQLIHEKNGVGWINDSKSTNVDSTRAALNSLQVKNNLWLLLGGDSKSANFSSLMPYLYKKNINIYCFGQDRARIASIRPEITTCTNTMQEAIYQIISKVKPGDMVLLSPACSSLDQFSNFQHRGDCFTQLVKELA